MIPHALSRALSSSPAADSFYLDRWATISHGEGLQGINSCFSPSPSLIYQTAHLSRAAACYCSKLAQATRSLCLNVFLCRRRLTREILQKTERERVLRCLVFGVHRSSKSALWTYSREPIKSQFPTTGFRTVKIANPLISSLFHTLTLLPSTSIPRTPRVLR